MSLLKSCVLLAGFLSASLLQAAAPEVSNVVASQRSGTKLVDIHYDLTKSDGGTCYVRVEISTDGGVRWRVPATTFTGAIGAGVSPGNNKLTTWNAGADFDGNFADNCKARVTAYDDAYPTPPAGMVYIPAGIFQMGDNLDSSSDAPVLFVTLDAFFMGRTEVTSDEYSNIRIWANLNGYDLPAYTGLEANHPVKSVNWYNACKYANARSEYEGLEPVYFETDSLITVWRTSERAPGVDWNANGYRLPTEAEWEKAARGGITGKRFPWGTDTISHTEANYKAAWASLSYDVSPTAGIHPQAHVSAPNTMPVGSFAPNSYGLYDMSGNLREWCWDRYASDYYGKDLSNPRGDDSGSSRVIRGGSARDDANLATSYKRNASGPSYNGGIYHLHSFRLVRNTIE